MSLSKEVQFLSALEQQLTQQYSQQLMAADSPQQETARSLGLLAARIRIIEEVLAKENRANTPAGLPPLLAGEVAIKIPHIVDNSNLLEVETYNGHEFRWSGPDPRLDFTVLVNRDVKKQILIDVIAVAKPDFIKRLSVYADGAQLKVTARQHKDIIQLVAKLPADAEKKDATVISILLPETVRPIEVGSGTDTRQLGIAICQVQVVELKGRLARFAI